MSKRGSSTPKDKSKTLTLKPCFSDELVIDGNYARQLLVASEEVTVNVADATPSFKLRSGETVHVVRQDASPRKGRALYVPDRVWIEHYDKFSDITGCKWIGDRTRSEPGEVLQSMAGCFAFKEDRPKAGQFGLRAPQSGALHAILSYWTTDPQEPATVVMPTGTGKTETMLAVYAHQAIERLLVLVPSDALREQLAQKFLCLGVLQKFGVVNAAALRPIVGQLGHRFSTDENAITFAAGINVVVATPQALRVSDPEIRKEFLSRFTHLFVDEAHHLGAASWQAVRDEFADRGVVQFTATPFREDGKYIKGKIIYSFPLREAQRQGYFSSIDYISVAGAGDTDLAVATTAVKRLRADIANGFDHLIMARVKRVSRAAHVLEIYEKLAPEFLPLKLENTMKRADRDAVMLAIRQRVSRIIVCVDMLGEGFDLPELKIAAVHDIHKSLGVTLQFVGRFARGVASLGPAAVVVGHPGSSFDSRLHELYREDADWNLVVRDLSETAVGAEEETGEFERAFSKRADGLTLQMLEPKMSAVIYRTQIKQWRLDGIPTAFKEGQLWGGVSANLQRNVAWFVTRNLAAVRWGTVPELTEVTYDLYVLYWDQQRALLYINSSNTDGQHETLAGKVCGENITRIKADVVYRSMSGIARLVPTNVGVLDSRSQARRFSMHVGADVSAGFPRAEEVTKTQTNIFASGFEAGNRVSIGASLKGRVWSYRVAKSLAQWTRWCDGIGTKVLDETLNIDAILRGFIRPQPLEERPTLVFLAAEWSWELFQCTSEETRLELHGSEWPLLDAELRVTTFGTTGPVGFEVITPEWRVSYEAEFTKTGVTYRALTADANLKRSGDSMSLSSFFRKLGVTFLLEEDAQIFHPGTLLRPDRELPAFDLQKIVAADWTGISLRKESQGKEKAPDSIQARTIELLLADIEWQVVLDDDGSGEAADIVALCANETELKVLLVHCKYASAGTPGARVEDLYEVCGQAQKSVRWGRSFRELIEHLVRRERNRARRGTSGFARGDMKALLAMYDRTRRLRPTLRVAIAQPGVSKARVTPSQLRLLASTELYLHETHLAEFQVFASA
ncbi:MAG TPA: DEAD/DEAH box helicase family protein [Polyangiaceae bacterium]|nr:DEAD/DEAH box helicase family protein [Polyangiaceae bacterium]